MFRRFKVQMLLVFGTFLLIFAAMILINNLLYIKKERINKSIDEISRIQIMLHKDILLMNNFYLYESRNIDFYRTKNSRYLAEHHQLFRQINNYIRQLQNKPEIRRLDKDDQSLARIEKMLKEFSDTFYKIVLLMSTRGYESSGLEGELVLYYEQLSDLRHGMAEIRNLKQAQQLFFNNNSSENYLFLKSAVNNLVEKEGGHPDIAAICRQYMMVLDNLGKLDAEIGYRFDDGLKYKTVVLSNEILKSVSKFVTEAEHRRDKTFHRMQSSLMLLYLLSGILFIIFSFQIAARMVGRISAIAKTIESFVASDFSVGHQFTLKETNDEIGGLIGNLRVMHSRIVTLIGNFKASVEEQTLALQQQNQMIEQKNAEIHHQMKQLSVKNAEIEMHLDTLNRKNRYILDSINFAKLIQEAMLPSAHNLESRFAESFLIYLPKDIVSGDFYWMKEFREAEKEYTLIAVADSTGHGVPGALMSMLGIAFLNEIVVRERTIEPDKILNKLRSHINNCLNSGSNYLDYGMDMAICLIDYSAMKIHFAGAKRPAYLLHQGEIIIIDGQNRSICRTGSSNHEFIKVVVDYAVNDQLYLFTDGIVDQIGGPTGSKYMKKRFKDHLKSISGKPMNIQKIEMHQQFLSWKGTREQLDDITVLGLRLTSAVPLISDAALSPLEAIHTPLN